MSKEFNHDYPGRRIGIGRFLAVLGLATVGFVSLMHAKESTEALTQGTPHISSVEAVKNIEI